MAALLVTLAVMTVLMTAAMPVLTTMAQRERETELVFRGQQYARAIALFQRKYGNALPPNLDVLLNEKFLRRKYKDPITGDDFQLLGPTSPELASALNAAPVTGQPGQQPRFNFRIAGKADVVAIDGIVGHQRLPEQALLSQLRDDLDHIDGTFDCLWAWQSLSMD